MIIRPRHLTLSLLLMAVTLPANGLAQNKEPKPKPQESPRQTVTENRPITSAADLSKGLEKKVEPKQKNEIVFQDIVLKDITGEEVDFKKYDGKVVLIVNVASKCGFTGQYRPLQHLHRKYNEHGLEIVAFPCNQFGKQEPLNEDAIAKFCHEKYGVEFNIYAKTKVKGAKKNELFDRLTRLDLEPAGKGEVLWNFEKFLVGKDGTPIARFRSNVSPNDKRIVAQIRSALGLPEEKQGEKKPKQKDAKKPDAAAIAEPNVIVVDTDGKPIKDAAVEQITASMNLGSRLTDEDGKVQISKRNIQKTEWISVTKKGYVSSGHIKFDQSKLIKVTLTPEPKKLEIKADKPSKKLDQENNKSDDSPSPQPDKKS